MACRSVEQGTGETQAAAVEAEPKTPPRGIANRLVDVRCWAVQLQGLDRPGARAALTACRFDLLVIEPMVSVRGQESFPIAEFVRELHGTRGTAAAAKRVLAYVNVGQAEAYRSYWKDDWVVPGEDHAGEPDFLLAADPEGWQGNYPVAWWDARWQEVLFGTPASLIDQAWAAGFDGLFLDWVLGFEEPAVAAAARAQGLQPAQAMADLLARLRVYARERDPNSCWSPRTRVTCLRRFPKWPRRSTQCPTKTSRSAVARCPNGTTPRPAACRCPPPNASPSRTCCSPWGSAAWCCSPSTTP
ncbi:MAG: endo alpha-1,4 polygalactosaminidase [Planctomycetota bacterium]